MDIPDAVAADLRVAAVAAGCTVALTLALRYGLGVAVSPLLRLSPVAVYFGYLFLGKGSTGSAFENPRLWMLLTVAVTVGTAAYAVV
ncbi:hypothetical protein [Haloplanus aerogenes]|uniref:DUF8049 domain-containing protein n=1 Tax=Haloplanus aerogenes TaxID=660522 RepID=A0A3M0D2C9_9EURY|nr:hypothetical protein [Haloplanus aerogenes]AZH25232.1 hypothetical protein DU502_07480 [Haloplanus aerogenes]RMB13539.1 hypothetical protein ATH50_1978 [Haloplanus aerogenes]